MNTLKIPITAFPNAAIQDKVELHVTAHVYAIEADIEDVTMFGATNSDHVLGQTVVMVTVSGIEVL